MSATSIAAVPTFRISGSGPVALACAMFMVRRGVPASRIAFDAGATPELPPTLARRSLAISHGTRQLLERIAPLPAAGTIETIDVSMPGKFGRTRIVARDLGVPALGYVIRYPALVDALRRAAVAHAWMAPDAPLPDAVIHAEGDAGENARVREFGQWALLTEADAESADAAPPATAFERFTQHGPLALLPLPEARRYSVVWCDRLATSEQRARLSLPELSAQLNRAFGSMLGALTVRDKPSLAPLARRSRRSLAAGNEVWIGNAAQALHPVAGQGLNLGLRDAFELADAVGDAVRRGVAPRFAFERFSRSRRSDRSLTIALTDLMASSFTWPLARPLQSALLLGLDLVPALRRPLADRLMFGWR